MEDVPAHTSVLVFAGVAAVPPAPVRGGLLCLGPGAIRLDVAQADATGRCEIESDLHFSNAGFLAGTTVHAQAAYRDAVQSAICAVNFTNGESVTLRN